MNERRTLFVGGARHLQWLTIPADRDAIELPAVEPALWPLADDGPSFRLDLYRIERLLHVDQHPCVPGAGVLRVLAVAVWSGAVLDPGPVARAASTGPVSATSHVGVPREHDAPTWWTWPMLWVDMLDHLDPRHLRIQPGRPGPVGVWWAV